MALSTKRRIRIRLRRTARDSGAGSGPRPRRPRRLRPGLAALLSLSFVWEAPGCAGGPVQQNIIFLHISAIGRFCCFHTNHDFGARRSAPDSIQNSIQSDPIRPIFSKSDPVRPSFIKIDPVRPNLTKADPDPPNLTETDTVRPNRPKIPSIQNLIQTDPIRPSLT